MATVGTIPIIVAVGVGVLLYRLDSRRLRRLADRASTRTTRTCAHDYDYEEVTVDLEEVWTR